VATATDAVLTDLNHQVLQHRAIEAAIWGMPIVSVNAMRQAYFRDAEANYNDVVFWSKPSDWKNQTTTPVPSARYVYFNVNTRDGPVVVEIPPAVRAGLFGTLLDAWQVPLAQVGPEGEDLGKGGKYLLPPPDFKGAIPAGHIILRPRLTTDSRFSVPSQTVPPKPTWAMPSRWSRRCGSIRWRRLTIHPSNAS
jgi:hypothetical protein